MRAMTAEEKKTIVDMFFRGGKTLDAICKESGLTSEDVSNILN